MSYTTVFRGKQLLNLSAECLEAIKRSCAEGKMSPGSHLTNCTTPENELLPRIVDYSHVCRVCVGLPTASHWGNTPEAIQQFVDNGYVGLYFVRENHPGETPFELEELENAKAYSLPYIKDEGCWHTNASEKDVERKLDIHEALTGWRFDVRDPKGTSDCSAESLKRQGHVGLYMPSSKSLRRVEPSKKVCNCGGPEGHVPNGMHCRAVS